MGSSIPELAEDCRNREFLAGFFEGWIEHEQASVDMGQTDQALVEKTLSLLEKEQDLLLINPFSYSLLPALISAAYTFAADTRTGETNVRSTGDPLLLFPKEGYIGDIEAFSYSDIVSGESIVDKRNISDLSEFEGGNTVYRVTDESVLQSSTDDVEVGLVFVDLRKDLWQNNVAEFEAFAARNQVRSILYYAEERDFATANVSDIVDEELEVTRSTLVEAATQTLGENPSRARREEYVLSEGVDITVSSVDPGELSELFSQLYEARQAIEKVVPDLYSVPEINNLLVELAVEPSIYDEQVRENFYYNSTRHLIEGIRDYRSQVEETVAGRLDEYWRLADELRQELENQNPKKRILVERVEDATESGRETIFIARNRMHLEAIEQGLFLTDIEIGDCIDFTTKSDVVPRPDARHVFVNLPGYNHPLYEFPPSTEVEFLLYPFLQNVVQREIQENEVEPENIESDATTGSVTIDNRDEIGRPDTVEFSRSEIESNVAQSLAKGNRSESGDNADSGDRDQAADHDRVLIEFSDGDSRETSARSMVTLLDPGAETVRRRPAVRVSQEDKIVILGDATTDLYETITEQQHQKESIQQRELLIERWREILNEGLDSEYSPSKLLNEMQDRGSDRQSTAAIQSWADGSTLGPRHHEDVHLVLEILRPGSEGASKEIHDAMRYIRTLHRRIGRRVHQIVEAELDPTREARFESGIGSQLNNIENKIDVKNVTNVKPV